ncbi:MAG: hypothetical protein H7Y07_02655 [Pyrinomonadaceae bacterium]|nr:hypothetical protein [Sphingobacteriaceae bacterium]
MRPNLFRTYFEHIFYFISILTLTIGCKKDQLIIDQTKEFVENKAPTGFPYDGGWHLTLQPDGIADILPSGDIVYRGTYKINGSTINVKTEQNSGSYVFEIISETEIKEKEYGVVLRLKQ